MTTMIETISSLPAVERVSKWEDRHYISLFSVRGSRANSDLRTKIWVKGNLLTIERGKGYNSDKFIAEKAALVEAVVQAGGEVREI